MKEKLRIGLLMNSYELSFWEYVLVERLVNSDYASIELVVINDYQEPKKTLLGKIKDNWRQLLFAVYWKLDRTIFTAEPDAFEIKDATSLLNGIPSMKVNTISTRFSDRFQHEDIATIKQYNLDILVRCGFKILRGDILKSSKYGVWSYHHGDNAVNRGGPAGFWEVMENWPETGSLLQILTEDLDNGLVLYRSFSQTDKLSINRNRNNYFWKSLSFLPRKLKELRDRGAQQFFKEVEQQNQYPSYYSNRLFTTRDISNWKMLRLITSHLVRYVKYRAHFDQWIILYRIGKGASRSFWKFKKLIPPRDKFWADPFIIHRAGKYYIYFEEFVYRRRKGHISLITMDEEGNYDHPVRILDKPYHLAYPFVFENEGDFYLIPDSHANKAIELYKCIEFPLKWEFQMNLMEKVKAVDSTMFLYGDKWWLFTSIAENCGSSVHDELFLFYSDTLYSKNWIPHPLNPIISDVKKARSAGSIFIERGRIYRPSQNSSKRYGYGLKINEIRTLNENEYEETEVASIEPNWERKIRATHTFNYTGNLTMIDASLRRRRCF